MLSRVAFALILAACAVSAPVGAEELIAPPRTRISIADFGAVPNDGENAAAAFRKALDFAKAHPGITLYVPPGTYHFRDDSAVQLMDQAMSGKLGPNPESTLFTAYYPYARGLYIRGVSGLTIEASGATLLFEGWMEPVSVDRSEDITIRGLTIDYKRRSYSSGSIVNVGSGYFDARIDEEYPINPRMPIPRVMFWEPQAHQILGESTVDSYRILAPQIVRVYTHDEDFPLPLHKRIQVGLVHSMHFRPAIFLLQSANIRLEDVTIHSQPGMGVLAHRSNNITLSGVRIIPARGSFISTTTDATHFVSCTGLIRIENSQFEGHGDDAINVHNYYYGVERSGQAGRYDLTLPLDNLHAGMLDYPDVGDSLDLVHSDSLEPIRSLLVKSVAIHPKELRTDVEFDGDLPPDLDKYNLVDTTRIPKVEIVGNSFLSHRARGALIKTRNVLIERNLFFENTGTAIHVAAEGGVQEGIPSANVVIRYNTMIGNGRGAGAIAGTSGIAVNMVATGPDRSQMHRGLLIEGNLIDGTGTAKCISISQADQVEIRYNELWGCKKSIDTQHSEHVDTHDNSVVTRSDGPG